jgi:hypothetical protein
MSTAVVMEPSGKSIGRTVGVLLLLHLAAGLTVPFILLNPIIAPPGFLVNAAANSDQVRAVVLLLFVGTALAIGIASIAWSVFRQYSSAMALWLLALGVASFALQAVDNAHLLSMLSLSQEYAKAGVEKADLFHAPAVVVGSARKWSHYSFLLAIGSWIFCFAPCCIDSVSFRACWQRVVLWEAYSKSPGSHYGGSGDIHLQRGWPCRWLPLMSR